MYVDRSGFYTPPRSLLGRSHWSLALVTAPQVEPLNLREAKLHLRVDSTSEDSLIGSLISAARSHAEAYLGQRLIQSTWKLALDRFPLWVAPESAILIPYPPLANVSSITYIDTNGASQTWSSSKYIVDTSSIPARLTPAYNESWPVTRYQMNAVTIQYVAGYGATSDTIPADILAGLKLFIGHLYENREAVVLGSTVAELPMAVRALWDAHRTPSFV